MKAITVMQPYASLIASGRKLVENRTWPTHYRGLLLIHAGKGERWWTEQYGLRAQDCPKGALVALATLTDCVPLAQVRGMAHASGPWCWLLADIHPLAPIPAIGRQGLWTPSIDPRQILAAQISHQITIK